MSKKKEVYKSRSFAQPEVDELLREIRDDPERRLLDTKFIARCSDHYVRVEYTLREEVEYKEEFEIIGE
ncbi:MAG: hypothetical protein R6U96_13120 [Promethearchaeia archaeon]